MSNLAFLFSLLDVVLKILAILVVLSAIVGVCRLPLDGDEALDSLGTAIIGALVILIALAVKTMVPV